MEDNKPTGLSREDATGKAAKKQIFKDETDPKTGKVRKYRLHHGLWEEIPQGEDLSEEKMRTKLQGAEVRKRMQALQREIDDLSRKIENAQKRRQLGKVEALQARLLSAQDELTRLSG